MSVIITYKGIQKYNLYGNSAFLTYIKMSKDSPATYYQDNKDRL